MSAQVHERFHFFFSTQILPLENKMKSPKDAPRIIFFSMTLVVTAFIVIGVLGYIVYGVDTKASITLNLKSNNIAEAM